ncbi:hypothetical protein SAMN05216266_11225 [Amycolatopsis marina]|uniref:Peptidase inhibitor family I36 n=1 Tax=Amycolatopsis marina TaxID=490629 RepID=A0A1I1B4I5_9PSEU|nr:hypothetical protein [Amycolatopsis marina]SFB45264.1 hypothetical protein SAMN05216266_11225 [Amycolatopsis marina]
MLRSDIRRTGAIAAVAVGATVLLASPASAAEESPAGILAQSCKTLSGPAGGSLPLCKTWVWDGNDYDGRWWTNGPSSLPSYSYLQRYEDGWVTNSAYSGSYSDRKKVHFRICDSRAGRCTSWW